MLKLVLFVLFLNLAAIPTADADCAVDVDGARVCTFETSESNGTCSDGNDFGITSVAVVAGGAAMSAHGWASCSGSSAQSYEWSAQNVRVTFFSDVTGWVQAEHYAWEQTSHGSTYGHCETWVGTDLGASPQLGCPAGPLPNPGWGRLLP